MAGGRFGKVVQSHADGNDLIAACEAAADVAMEILAAAGLPHFVPNDPAQWKVELRFILSRAMATAIAKRTGHGAALFGRDIGE